MMWSTLRIGLKLPLAIALVATVATIVSGTIIAVEAGRSLERSTVDRLISVGQARKSELASYLTSIEGDLVVLAQSDLLKDALINFSAGWRTLASPETTLQRLYIGENPYPTGEKDQLASTNDGSSYDKAHAHYHPWFRTLLKDRGYYDIFLFNARGDLVYTVFKELDYATNLITGQWANSSLGRAFRAASANPREGHVSFFDFEPYEPSHGAAASFISIPLMVNGKFDGVFAVQTPIGRINAMMGKTEGLGLTGETFIVGTDGKFRSATRFDKKALLKHKINSQLLDALENGGEGVIQAPTYTGTPGEQAFTSLDFHGVRWAVVTSIHVGEIEAEIYDFYLTTAIATLAIGAFATMIGIVVGRGITQPITHLGGVA
jgi:methyl-accepting chemotaxis protein